MTSIYVSKGCHATTLTNLYRNIYGLPRAIYVRSVRGGRGTSTSYVALYLFPTRIICRLPGLSFRSRVFFLGTFRYLHDLVRFYKGLCEGLIILIVSRIRVVRRAFSTSRLGASAFAGFFRKGGFRRSSLSNVYRVDSTTYASVRP